MAENNPEKENETKKERMSKMYLKKFNNYTYLQSIYIHNLQSMYLHNFNQLIIPSIPIYQISINLHLQIYTIKLYSYSVNLPPTSKQCHQNTKKNYIYLRRNEASETEDNAKQLYTIYLQQISIKNYTIYKQKLSIGRAHLC